MVEHKIGLIKLFKIVANRYRNRRQRYDFGMKLYSFHNKISTTHIIKQLRQIILHPPLA